MARIWNKPRVAEQGSLRGKYKQTPFDYAQDKNTPLKKKVFVALSGGVDSSVAAFLLKEQGYDVVGVYMKCWDGLLTPDGVKFRNQCTWREDRRDAMRVAAKLKIPFQTWDFTREYNERVVEYFFSEYAAGRTPNPDVMCNREIKFKLFLERALTSSADYIATGHYARVIQNAKGKSQNLKSKFKNVFELCQAKDSAKDQSYFLYTLTQHELKYVLFPIGEYGKAQVRELARRAGLSTSEKPDSQGICFVGEVPVADFLRARLPLQSGTILTNDGRLVGEHDGVAFYTIGQRHGMKISSRLPYYVAAKNVAENVLVVGEGPVDSILYKQETIIDNVTWVSEPPKENTRLLGRIRYRQPLESGVLRRNFERDGTWRFIFAQPQRAVTPGQSLVLYDGERLVGGGVICDA